MQTFSKVNICGIIAKGVYETLCLCVQFPDRIPVGQVAALFAVQTTAEELAPFADG